MESLFAPYRRDPPSAVSPPLLDLAKSRVSFSFLRQGPATNSKHTRLAWVFTGLCCFYSVVHMYFLPIIDRLAPTLRYTSLIVGLYFSPEGTPPVSLLKPN